MNSWLDLWGLIVRLQVLGLDREAAGFRGLIVRLRVWGLIVRCEGLIVRCIKIHPATICVVAVQITADCVH